MYRKPIEYCIELLDEIDVNSSSLSENQRVRFCFLVAYICRIHYETMQLSGTQASMSLAVAVDFIDRTLPSKELLLEIKEITQKNPQLDQLSILFENTSKIGAIPPGLWKKPKGDPSFLGESNYKIIDRVEKWHKNPEKSSFEIRKTTLDLIKAKLGLP